MTTTLPASIPAALVPDVLRKCSPVLVETEDGVKSAIMHVAQTRADREAGRRGYLYAPIGQYWYLPSVCSLDLTDPTGFFHGLLYLAEKLGMDPAKGLLWYRVEKSAEDHGQSTPAHWVLQGLAPDPDGISPARWHWVFTEEPTVSAEYHWAKMRMSAFQGGGMVEDLFAPNGYTTVPGILGTESDAEALRLAVLAVVGVQG